MLVTLATVVALLSPMASTAAAKRAIYVTYAGGLPSAQPFSVATDGSIAALGAANTGASPRGLAITPDGKRLFVANSGATTISGFNLDATTGALTAATTATDPNGAVALAITPDGTTLFAANPSGSVSALAIDQFNNASPLPLGGATLTATSPDGIAVSPDGSHLFVAEGSANKLAVFAIGTGGTLTPVGTGDTGAGPTGVTISPDGFRVYVADAGDGDVTGFSVSAQGALTPLANSPYTAASGASSIAMAPDGKRLLVANGVAGSLTPFLIDATTGALAPQGTKTGLAGAAGVAVSPDGKYAYVADGSKTRAFAFGADAALTQVGSALDLAAQAGGLAIAPNLAPYATFDPSAAPATTSTRFSGDTAHDDDGSIVKWHWDFGDGATSDDTNPQHVFAQAGSYNVKLTVVDNEGCSAVRVFTGQTISCAGSSSASQSHTIQVPPAPDTTPTPPPCQHNGNDGFCGTPDQTAPTTTVLGFNDGANITTLDAPDTIVGTIANDPSGIKSVMLRFTKAAGFVVKKKKVRQRVCHKVKGRKKKKCVRKTVTKKVKTRTTLCLAPPAGNKNYLAQYVCSKAPWISVGGTDQFRWVIPVGLGIGTYTVDVIAMDGAGNADTLEAGRNHMTFKIIKTPTNSGTGTGTTTPPTTTTTTPITDTGSPFGSG